MKRSYRQNCALADGLDLIGERWTLLVVRELLVAPRRYGELMDNLMGIGTNLLASRLKEMEANGLVTKDGAVYALTEAGRSLAPVIWEIVRFGLSLGIADQSARLTRPEWDAVALRAMYDPKQDRGLSGRYLVELNGFPFCVEKHGANVAVQAGRCSEFAAAVSLSKRTARKLAAGSLKFADAIDEGKLKIEGGRREAGRLLAAFGLSLPAARPQGE